MIPDYKLYHGAVLAELVCELAQPVTVDELSEEGRLSSYVLDGRVGLHIKHSAQRLGPWPFTFTSQNLEELRSLGDSYRVVFIVLVCRTDGMACLSLEQLGGYIGLIDGAPNSLRVARRKRQWYAISGSVRQEKYPSGLNSLLSELQP